MKSHSSTLNTAASRHAPQSWRFTAENVTNRLPMVPARLYSLIAALPSPMKLKHIQNALCAAALVATGLVQAAPVIRGGTVTSPGDPGGCGATAHAGDQSGLSGVPYISGTTNFNTSVPATTHSPTACNVGYTNVSGVPQPYTLDLGAIYTVDGLALWDEPLLGLFVPKMFNLYEDVDANFNNGKTLINSFITLPPLSWFGLADVFAFVPTSARYFHIDVLSGPISSRTGIGELAMREPDSKVPEPGSLALAGLSLVLLSAFGRRRKPAALLAQATTA